MCSVLLGSSFQRSCSLEEFPSFKKMNDEQFPNQVTLLRGHTGDTWGPAACRALTELG